MQDTNDAVQASVYIRTQYNCGNYIRVIVKKVEAEINLPSATIVGIKSHYNRIMHYEGIRIREGYLQYEDSP